MTQHRDIFGITVGVATIIGSIAIPIAISFGEVYQTWTREKENRKVGIAQILSENYDASCLKKVDTEKLISSWFNIDAADVAGLINYLYHDFDSCSEEEQILILDRIRYLQTYAALRKLIGYIDAKEKEILLEENEKVKELVLESLLSTLDKYKINIHYLESKQALKSEAECIEKKLEESLDKLKVQVRGLSQAWFDSTGGLSDNQIRYEREKEDKAAIALQQLLTKVYPAKQFRLQTIRGSTSNSISIFLKEPAMNKKDCLQ